MYVKTWVNILVTKNCKGAVAGVWVMNFEAGKRYRVDLPLAEKLMDMGVAAPTPNADYVLHVTDTRIDKQGQTPATWGAPKND